MIHSIYTKIIACFTLVFFAAITNAESLSKQQKIEKIITYYEGTVEAASAVSKNMFDNAKVKIKESLEKEKSLLDKQTRESKAADDYFTAIEKLYDDYFTFTNSIAEKVTAKTRSNVEKLYAQYMTDEDLNIIVNYIESSAGQKSLKMTNEMLPQLIADVQNSVAQDIIKESQSLEANKVKLYNEFSKKIAALKHKPTANKKHSG